MRWRESDCRAALLIRNNHCRRNGQKHDPEKHAPHLALSHMEFSMSRPCERRDPSVSAIALIAAARTLVSALEQRPFFTFEARGDGSLRSQGRPAERLCEATSVGRSWSYAIALAPGGGRRFSLATNENAFARRSCSGKKMERDDDSKKSHPALACAAASLISAVMSPPEGAGGTGSGEVM